MENLTRITNDELETFRLNFSRCGNRDVGPLIKKDSSRTCFPYRFSLRIKPKQVLTRFFKKKKMLHVLVFSPKVVEISSICIPKREPTSVCATFEAEHRVPRDRVTFGQQQESRLLVRPDILSMGRVLVLYS